MRVRFRFSKLGKVRFTSQRDIARMWERALRRAQLPVAYSGGFSPRPQLSFGLALPTGCESLAEYLDVVFDDARPETASIELAMLPTLLSPMLPDGVEVQRAVLVGYRPMSLQREVTSCSWVMSVEGLSRSELESRVDALLDAPMVTIARERKGRQEQDDLRPSVLGLMVLPSGQDGAGTARTPDFAGLGAELATRPRGVRPVELLRGLIAVGAPELNAGRLVEKRLEVTPSIRWACRTKQWIERDGARWEPVAMREEPPEAERALRALERAS